jgi:hypothetical protein
VKLRLRVTAIKVDRLLSGPGHKFSRESGSSDLSGVAGYASPPLLASRGELDPEMGVTPVVLEGEAPDGIPVRVVCLQDHPGCASLSARVRRRANPHGVQVGVLLIRD